MLVELLFEETLFEVELVFQGLGLVVEHQGELLGGGTRLVTWTSTDTRMEKGEA